MTGLLIGFGARNQANISMSLRRELESAIEQAVNLALQEAETSSEFARSSIAMMLSHAFDLLGDGKKLNFNHDLLLPILIHASFFSKEGLHYGYFLSTIDSDVVQNEGMKFDWSPHSSTYVQCQRMDSAPLMSSLGSLSRMTAFSVENVRNVDFLLNMMKDISEFTRSLYVQWQQNKLSEIDIKEESVFLSKVSLSTTIPLLWRILKNSMFAVIIILRSLLGRMLGDVRMPEEGGKCLAPTMRYGRILTK